MNIADRTLPINGYCMVHSVRKYQKILYFVKGGEKEKENLIFGIISVYYRGILQLQYLLL